MGGQKNKGPKRNSDIVSDISDWKYILNTNSDSLSDILSGIYSDILSMAFYLASREKEEVTLIKSRDPHLAGGEQDKNHGSHACNAFMPDLLLPIFSKPRNHEPRL